MRARIDGSAYANSLLASQGTTNLLYIYFLCGNEHRHWHCSFKSVLATEKLRGWSLILLYVRPVYLSSTSKLIRLSSYVGADLPRPLAHYGFANAIHVMLSEAKNDMAHGCVKLDNLLITI